ncbi:4'-phosphopantetheinyl transferase family protein [Burkholderiaceae bacterium UC74_6]
MPELALGGLADGTVEIGWLVLDEGAGDLAGLLSPDERERAGRFRAPAARATFMQSRAALRRRLGHCLGLAPGEVPISLSANGQPELTAGAGLPDLRFNLAHTHGLMLCAFALGRRVGIDVELRAPDLPWLDMAGTAFSAAEQAALAALPADARRMGFYAGWTRKEAWLKGLGTGFSARALQVTDVPVDPRTLAALPLRDPSGAVWNLCDLTIADWASDCAAALACEGEPPPLRWLDLSAWPNRSGA